MSALTKPIQTGVATFVNLLTALRAAGYTGGQRPTLLTFYNASAVTPVYLHFHNTNSASGLTGNQGIPISSAAAPATPMHQFYGNAKDMPDLNHIFVWAAADVPVTVAVVGE